MELLLERRIRTMVFFTATVKRQAETPAGVGLLLPWCGGTEVGRKTVVRRLPICFLHLLVNEEHRIFEGRVRSECND